MYCSSVAPIQWEWSGKQVSAFALVAACFHVHENTCTLLFQAHYLIKQPIEH